MSIFLNAICVNIIELLLLIKKRKTFQEINSLCFSRWSSYQNREAQQGLSGLALEPVSKLSCGRCLLQTPELREPGGPFRVEKGKVSTQAERSEIQARICWLLYRDL